MFFQDLSTILKKNQVFVQGGRKSKYPGANPSLKIEQKFLKSPFRMLAFEKEQAQQQPSKPLVAQTMIWKWDCVSCFACSGANENPPSRLRASNSGTFEPFEDAPPPCYPRNHSCASPKLQAICQTLDQALSECHLNCSELLLPYLVPELGP